ncbi:Transposase [Paracoccus aminovorans]|uniref:Transposase n=1 Tax=Paracoccus aminovorans TaxID=34004 RepID=A0A1I2YI48_9RHOB|nr:IS3 family transposase [Paracoccus aminovorans]SFH24766.1 Transposase [Paracoccus aminovorans]
MTRRKFSREFKVEAVRLMTDRGVAVAQAALDLYVAESVLRRRIRELTTTPTTAFPPERADWGKSGFFTGQPGKSLPIALRRDQPASAACSASIQDRKACRARRRAASMGTMPDCVR